MSLLTLMEETTKNEIPATMKWWGQPLLYGQIAPTRVGIALLAEDRMQTQKVAQERKMNTTNQAKDE